MVLATPIAIGTALFINLYAPAHVRRGLIVLVDLLAAVPSLIFGLWGFYYLQPHLVDSTRWLNQNASFIPIFKNGSGIRGGSIFLAGIVVAIMILPTMTAITRDVLSAGPVLSDRRWCGARRDPGRGYTRRGAAVWAQRHRGCDTVGTGTGPGRDGGGFRRPGPLGRYLIPADCTGRQYHLGSYRPVF